MVEVIVITVKFHDPKLNTKSVRLNLGKLNEIMYMTFGRTKSILIQNKIILLNGNEQATFISLLKILKILSKNGLDFDYQKY